MLQTTVATNKMAFNKANMFDPACVAAFEVDMWHAPAVLDVAASIDEQVSALEQFIMKAVCHRATGSVRLWTAQGSRGFHQPRGPLFESTCSCAVRRSCEREQHKQGLG